MSHRALRIVYGVIAVVALIATWSQNIRHFAQDDSGGLWGFVKDGYANPAAASLTNDLLLLMAAAWVFMWVEGRRLGMRHLWVYFLLSPTVAISVAFPLFMMARERRLEVSEAL